MLVVVTVVVCGVGWLGSRVQKGRQQQTAVAVVEKLGGNVQFDYEFNSQGWEAHAISPGPAWLRALLGDHFFGNVKIVNLSDTRVTDDDLTQLKGLAKLEFLVLNRTQVTDAGMKNLIGLSRLKRLDLHDTQVTDAGVSSLQKSLPDCEIHWMVHADMHLHTIFTHYRKCLSLANRRLGRIYLLRK
jgi:hypothetical protein